MSAPRDFTVKGTFRKPCTASQWSRAFEPAFLSARGDAGDVGDGAGLVVYEHERDEHGVGPQGVEDGLHGYGPALVGRKARDLIAPALQLVEGPAHGVVLGHGAYDVPAICRGCPRAREQCPVVGLGAAGGEDEFLRLAAEAERDLAPGAVEQLLRLAPPRVGRAGVAVLLGHYFVSDIRGLGTDPRRGRVVKIDVQIITLEVL